MMCLFRSGSFLSPWVNRRRKNRTLSRSISWDWEKRRVSQEIRRVSAEASSSRSFVTVVDIPERRILKTVETGRGTCGLTMTGDERYVVASNDRDDSISVIDTVSESVVNTISAKPGFHALGLTDSVRIQGISADRDDSIFVYECSGAGAIVRFDDILGKGKYTISWKGKKYEG